MGGSYDTNAQLDISQLPAGNYSCSVRNSHGAYFTNSSDVAAGAIPLFNYTIQTGYWATGTVNVQINSTCSISSTAEINHGKVNAGTTDLKQIRLPVACNKDNNVRMTLISGVPTGNGIEVNIGASKSVLSVSGDGVNYNSEAYLNVTANVSTNIYIKSELKAEGYGYQSGNAVTVLSYD